MYPATQTEEELHDIDRLIEQIHAAFTGVVLGKGETIHQADLEGIYDKDEKEWIKAGEKDPETEWSEVPGWKFERNHSSLSFFDVEGWRFYLPGFMCWSLRNWRTSDSITPDSIVWNLTYDEFMSSKYESLDRAQSEAVLDFLEFFDRYSPDDDAGEAIRLYWHQFKKN